MGQQILKRNKDWPILVGPPDMLVLFVVTGLGVSPIGRPPLQLKVGLDLPERRPEMASRHGLAEGATGLRRG